MRAVTSTATEECRETPGATRAHLTVAHAILVALTVLAAVLRFSNLDALPLSPEEAERALAVWRFWQPGPLPELQIDVSPAYFSLTALLMAVLGDGDVVARLVPALSGTLLVPIPWLWRRRLGTLGSLTATLLLAGSPTINILSRTAGGDSLALAATLLLFVGWMRYQEKGEGRWLVTSLVALGLGLASSPLFYSGLATLSLAWLIQVRLGRLLEMHSGDGRVLSWSNARPAVAVGAVVFLALSTMFLWRPAGLGAAATQAAEWIGRFGLRSDLSAILSPFLALGRYEVIAVILGSAAIVWGSWRGLPVPLFLVYWFAASVVLILLQQGTMANVVFLVLPAYLLIGVGIDRVFRQNMSPAGWLLSISILALGMVAYVNAARYLRLMTFDPTQVNFLLLAFIAVASIGVGVNFVRSLDREAALQGALAGLFLLLFAYGWGTAWWLGQDGSNDPRERWVTVGADDDVRLLAQVLSEISWRATGNDHDLEVLAGLESPVLSWYLRDFDRLQVGKTVPSGADQAAIITPEGTEPQLGENYFGADFALLQTGAVLPEFSTGGLGQSLRWWIFHEHPATIEKRRVILWVRNDGPEQ